MWSLDIFWTLNSEKEYEKYLLSVSQKMIQSLFDERLISFLSEMLIRKPHVLDPCWNFNKIYPFSCRCRESKLFILPLPAKVFTKVHKLPFCKDSYWKASIKVSRKVKLKTYKTHQDKSLSFAVVSCSTELVHQSGAAAVIRYLT